MRVISGIDLDGRPCRNHLQEFEAKVAVPTIKAEQSTADPADLAHVGWAISKFKRLRRLRHLFVLGLNELRGATYRSLGSDGNIITLWKKPCEPRSSHVVM